MEIKGDRERGKVGEEGGEGREREDVRERQILESLEGDIAEWFDQAEWRKMMERERAEEKGESGGREKEDDVTTEKMKGGLFARARDAEKSARRRSFSAEDAGGQVSRKRSSSLIDTSPIPIDLMPSPRPGASVVTKKPFLFELLERGTVTLTMLELLFHNGRNLFQSVCLFSSSATSADSPDVKRIPYEKGWTALHLAAFLGRFGGEFYSFHCLLVSLRLSLSFSLYLSVDLSHCRVC